MRIARLFVLTLLAAPISFGQVVHVTHGQPPTLPKPFTKPIVANPPEGRPTPGFMPKALPGFQVSLFAKGFREPRYLAIAPNGDVFLADTSGGRVYVLHDPGNGAASGARTTFADGLNEPFGIAFHGNFVYVADTDEVIRFAFDPKTSKRTGGREHVLDLPSGGMHFTRTIVFSQDGSKMFVSAGSDCNVCIEPDARRAAIQVADPDGKNASIIAQATRKDRCILAVRVRNLDSRAAGVGFDADIAVRSGGNEHFGTVLTEDDCPREMHPAAWKIKNVLTASCAF